MFLFPSSVSSTWLLDLFLNNVWLAIGLWGGLFCLDYVFTIKAARLYRDGALQHFVFPEGIELNAFFQDDIAKVRKFSFRFFLMLFFIAGLLLIGSLIPEMFAFLWGMLVGIQLANHCRHIHGLAAFSYARRSVGVSGKIQYEHWLSLRSWSVRLPLFRSAISNSVFLVGASLCLGRGCWLSFARATAIDRLR